MEDDPLNSSQKKAGVATLISDNTDSEPKNIDKDGHYIKKRGKIFKITVFITIYITNIGTSKYIKQLLTVKKILTATQ